MGAAFALEAAWILTFHRRGGALPLATLALLKPTGIIFALCTGFAMAAPVGVPLIAGGVFGLWLIRDAVLWKLAVIPPQTTVVGGVISTTVLGHGFAGLATLGRVALADNPLTFLCGLTSIVGVTLSASTRRLGVVALLFFIIALVSPFGFENGRPQLDSGQSLRFFLPTIVVGFVLLSNLVRRFSLIVGATSVLAVLLNVRRVLDIFWNDATTHDTVLVSGIVAVLLSALLVTRHRWKAATYAAGLLLFLCVAVRARGAAGSHPSDYYTDQIPLQTGSKSGLYDGIVRRTPGPIIAYGLNAGNIIILSPKSSVVDGLDGRLCEQSHALHMPIALIFREMSEKDLRGLRGCTTSEYQDSVATILHPK